MGGVDPARSAASDKNDEEDEEGETALGDDGCGNSKHGDIPAATPLAPPTTPPKFRPAALL